MGDITTHKTKPDAKGDIATVTDSEAINILNTMAINITGELVSATDADEDKVYWLNSHIAAIDAACNALRERMGRIERGDSWTNIDKELPKEYGEYLVIKTYPGYKSDIIPFIDLVYFTRKYKQIGYGSIKNNKRNVFYKRDDEWGDYEISNIQYWMSPPELPSNIKESMEQESNI